LSIVEVAVVSVAGHVLAQTPAHTAAVVNVPSEPWTVVAGLAHRATPSMLVSGQPDAHWPPASAPQ
jgi:hypothetical protein